MPLQEAATCPPVQVSVPDRRDQIREALSTKEVSLPQAEDGLLKEAVGNK